MIKFEHLLGIPYIHGDTDCYEICRRFYKDNFDINLKNYSRPTEWWDHGFDLYMDNYYEEGFRIIDIPINKARIGDAFLISIRSSVANHAAIYVGDNNILHHPYQRLSTVESYKGLWRNFTVATLRHPKVPDLSKNMNTLNFIDLLPESQAKKLTEALNGQA